MLHIMNIVCYRKKKEVIFRNCRPNCKSSAVQGTFVCEVGFFGAVLCLVVTMFKIYVDVGSDAVCRRQFL